jgi:hypothetical protein
MYSRAAQPFQWEFFTVTRKLISRLKEVQARIKKEKANKPTKANRFKMLWGRKGESGKKKKAVSI